MQSLPIEIIQELLIICPIKTIGKLVSLNKQFYQSSRDQYVWQQKLKRVYPYFILLTDNLPDQICKYLHQELLIPSELFSKYIHAPSYRLCNISLTLSKKVDYYTCSLPIGVITNIHLIISKNGDDVLTVYHLIDRILVRKYEIYDSVSEQMDNMFVQSPRELAQLERINRSEMIYHPLLKMKKRCLIVIDNQRIKIYPHRLFGHHLTNIELLLTYLV